MSAVRKFKRGDRAKFIKRESRCYGLVVVVDQATSKTRYRCFVAPDQAVREHGFTCDQDDLERLDG